MAYYAKVINNQVVQTIVAEQSFIDSNELGISSDWVEYKKDGSIRANFASINSVYDSINDVFYKQKPYFSWTLNETTWEWEAPTAYPNDGKRYYWNEATTNWVEVV
jgi:hypothetical protein